MDAYLSIFDLVRAIFREQPYCCLKVMWVCLLKSETSLKEKPQCGLNVAFDSEATRLCDKIKDIKLEATLWFDVVLVAMVTVVFWLISASTNAISPTIQCRTDLFSDLFKT